MKLILKEVKINYPANYKINQSLQKNVVNINYLAKTGKLFVKTILSNKKVTELSLEKLALLSKLVKPKDVESVPTNGLILVMLTTPTTSVPITVPVSTKCTMLVKLMENVLHVQVKTQSIVTDKTQKTLWFVIQAILL